MRVCSGLGGPCLGRGRGLGEGGVRVRRAQLVGKVRLRFQEGGVGVCGGVMFVLWRRISEAGSGPV